MHVVDTEVGDGVISFTDGGTHGCVAAGSGAGCTLGCDTAVMVKGALDCGTAGL